ncbi:hypothetical protein D3C79_1022440 [compost metagenome]
MGQHQEQADRLGRTDGQAGQGALRQLGVARVVGLLRAPADPFAGAAEQAEPEDVEHTVVEPFGM